MMSKSKKIYAYKVVKSKALTGGRHSYWSAVALHYRIRVRYIPNEWVSPKIKDSMLMVFKTEGAARWWTRRNKWGNQIWRCEVEGLRRIDDCLAVTRLQHEPATVKRFWGHMLHLKTVLKFVNGVFMNSASTPSGSYAAERVKLLTRVK